MYLLIGNETTAKSISEALWSLSVPNSSGATRYYCEWITHPTTGESILDIPNKSLYIHPEANINALDSFLSPLITAGELERVHYVLEVSRNGGSDPGNPDYIPGNKLNFLDFLPQNLKNLIRTEEELKLAGWFPSLDEQIIIK